MMYRGEDMDLRVPPVRQASPRGGLGEGDRLGPGAGRGPRGEAIWVDETVLACCNNAYDLALAHGSAEVRILHLVHALTRVEAAAQVLEARGIREAHLRRESLDLILGEVPIGLGERGSPRRSAELQEVLQRASELAWRRGVEAAAVDDVLAALLSYPRDTVAVTLLRRHAPDWTRRERLPPLAEPRRPMPEPRAEPLLLAEPVASRLDAIEATVRSIQAEIAGERRLLAEVARDLQRELSLQRAESSAAVTGLGDRLATLEHHIAARIEGIRIPSHLSDRLQAIEGAVHAHATDTVRRLEPVMERVEALMPLLGRLDTLSELQARMEGLENAVRAGLGEGARNWAGLAQRLNGIEGAIERGPAANLSLAPLIERLNHIETALAALPASATGLAPLVERIGALERQLESRSADTLRGWTAMSDRLQALEGQIKGQGGESQRQWSLLVDALEDTRKALSRNGESAVDGALAERLGGIERTIRTGLADTTRNVTLIAERLVAVERAAQTREPPEAALLLDERLRALEASLEGRARETGGRWLELTQRLDAIDRRIGEARLQGVSAAVSAAQRIDPEVITTPMLNEVARLAQTAEARHQLHTQALSEIVGRIAALEQVVQANGAGFQQTAQGLEGIIVQLHKGMVQLGENQQTLASALKDWRTENKRDLGLISDRLEPLLHGGAAVVESRLGPATRTQAQSENGLHPKAQVAVERSAASGRTPARVEHADGSRTADAVAGGQPPSAANGSGHGFWWWLFGTQNVRQANRDAELRWQAMHQNLKAARERLRDRA